MDIDDTENPFGDGVDNRGVDYGDDEIGMQNLNLTIHLRVVVQLILQHLTALIKKLHLQQVEVKGHRCWVKNFKKTDKRRPK